MTSLKLYALLPCLMALPAAAHLTMWHPAMFNYEPDDMNAIEASNPLHMLKFDQWWFHGDLDKPPADGQFLEIPSGGSFVGQQCNRKSETPWGGNNDPNLHAKAFNVHLGDPIHMGEMKGSAIAIVYESDPHKAQPEDFVVISTNQTGPYWRETVFGFPAGMPACPPGGCLCMWGWVHSPLGGGSENYFTGYRCVVTNADPNAKPLAKPQVARKCPYDKTNCTVGAKQPHFWMQQERNNNFQDGMDPPYYNHEYGFYDGPQPDIWMTDGTDHYSDYATNTAHQAPNALLSLERHFDTTPYTGTQDLPATQTAAAPVPTSTASGLGLEHNTTRADQGQLYEWTGNPFGNAVAQTPAPTATASSAGEGDATVSGSASGSESAEASNVLSSGVHELNAQSGSPQDSNTATTATPAQVTPGPDGVKSMPHDSANETPQAPAESGSKAATIQGQLGMPLGADMGHRTEPQTMSATGSGAAASTTSTKNCPRRRANKRRMENA